MEKTIKIFKAFSEKGYRAALSHTIEGLDELPLNHSIRIAETALLCEWLRLNHGIWISVFYKRHSENKHYGFNIRQANGIETVLWEFESPQEAYSAAFDYINENNLI